MEATARSAIFVVFAGLLTMTPRISSQAGRTTNYPGTYAATDTSAANLVVKQSENGIEFARTASGKTEKGSCPFNGVEGDYVTSGGMPGKCKAQMKSKSLIVDSIVVSRPDPSSPAVRVQTKEEWKLSSDGRTLSIKSTVDFPDAPPGVSGVVAESFGSLTQKYERTASQ